MLRRRAAAGVLPTCAALRRQFSATSIRLREVDPEERQREVELRNKISQLYRGMPVPELQSFEYGHFATEGINAQAKNQAFSDAFKAGTNSSVFSGTSFAQNNASTGAAPKKDVDWIMLFTGCMLVFITGQMLYRQARRDVDDLEIPLWVASVDVQAKHLVFSIQFDHDTREQLKKDFHIFRQTQPFADFFEWVRTQRPEFGFGAKYSMDYVMGTMASILTSTNSQQLLSFAQALQKGMTRHGGSPQQRLDDFIDKVQAAGAMFSAMPVSTSPFRASSSAVPPSAFPFPSSPPPSQYLHSDNQISHDAAVSASAPTSAVASAPATGSSEVHGSVPFQ